MPHGEFPSLYFGGLHDWTMNNVGSSVFQLDDLGNLCGLMPGMTPSETELQTVCMLLASIGKTQGEGQLNFVAVLLLSNTMYIQVVALS